MLHVVAYMLGDCYGLVPINVKSRANYVTFRLYEPRLRFFDR
jgi:hypothetical protein